MKFKLLNRKVHHWLSIAAALPVLVILCSGLLLQLKKELAWVQPPEKRGVGKVPTLSFEQLLEASRTVPEAEVRDWSDIQRIDSRPSRGVHKVWTKNGWEVQIDAQTGAVLHAAYRRSDVIEAIHDGSWFHELAKHWVFLPAGVSLLLLWVTGLILFVQPYVQRRRRKTLAAQRQAVLRAP